MHLVPLLAPSFQGDSHTKDIDFTAVGIQQRWEAGYAHTRDVLSRTPWIGDFDPLSGVILHEQIPLPAAAE
jgi:NTE family protein